MSSDIKKNPNAVSESGAGGWHSSESSYDPGKDLTDQRRQTLRDYLKASTEGDRVSYGATGGPDQDNPISGNDISIDESMANHFPIDMTAVKKLEITDWGNNGLPGGITNIQDTQTHFMGMNAAKEIFNQISSGIFFDTVAGQAGTIASTVDSEAGEDFKNTQTFGHSAGSKTYTQTVSEQVSQVLLKNRFAPTAEYSEISAQTAAQSDFRSGGSLEILPGLGGQIYFNDKVLSEASPNPGGAGTPGSVDAIGDKLRRLGPEATLAASGYTGDAANASDTAWGDVFDAALGTFQVQNIVHKNGGYGLAGANEGGLLNTGTARLSSRQTNPTRDWFANQSVPDLSLTYIDSSGRPKDDQDDSFGSEDSFSWGVMNNYIDQFTGDMFGRQYVQSMTFMLGIFVQNLLYAAALDVLLLLELLAIEKQRTNLFAQYDPENVQLAKGKSRGYAVPISELDPHGGFGDAADIMELFGLPDLGELLSGPYLLELLFNWLGIQKPVGTRTYFEIGGFKIGLITSFLPAYMIGSVQTFISVLKDPMSGGFWNNVGRQIVRKSAERAPPPAESEDGLAFINFFLELREQAAFRFFKTMIDLGDNSINSFFYEHQTTNRKTGAKYPALDAVYENRVPFNGKTVYAAATSLTPSYFLIPKSFQQARNILSSGGYPLGSFLSGVPIDGYGDQFHNMEDDGHQLDKDTVKAIEQQIDSQGYMPFYIKDLRTNEIISFHAFLNSFSDGFSATYSGIKGMGRIEEAPIYQSSQRSISLSFTLMATSPEDMDMVYWKMNKLVTLLYPQWSKGTKMLGGADGKRPFYMPFSQIPTASPMVRLRVGDILTSNYSAMSAARLMGLGQKDTLESAEGVKDGLANAEPIEPPQFPLPGLGESPPVKATASSELITRYVAGEDYFNDEDRTDAELKDARAKLKPEKNIFGISQAPLPGLGVEGHVDINDKVILATTAFSEGKVKTGKVIVPSIPIANTGALIAFKGKQSYKAAGDEGQVFVIIGFEAVGDDIHYWLAYDSYVGADETNVSDLMAVLVGDEKNTGSGNAPDKICFRIPAKDVIKYAGGPGLIDEDSKNFIKKNTIIKSFNNTYGEGLAGFIDNLQFDWGLGQIMWGTGQGNRAPQGCKITMNFKPVHDITPGIDADGFNRAPVFKVGKLSREINRDFGVIDGRDQALSETDD